jgi:hypothetical protein
MLGAATASAAPSTAARGKRHRVLVNAQGPGEWIVRSPAGGQALHVYRLAPCDWLVSEVGKGNEGRGEDLRQALEALAGQRRPPGWWEAIPATIEDVCRKWRCGDLPTA